MSRTNSTFRAVSDRAAPRSVRCCAVLGGPLLMLFVGLASASAQQSGTAHWFTGVERGTETPEVAHAPPPERRSRQPSYYHGSRRVVQAQAQSTPRPPTSAESLPLPSRGSPIPPQSSSPAAPPGDRIQGTLPISGWDADVDIAQGADGRIDRLVVRDASLSKVLALLAQTYHLNIVAANDIDAVISITLRNVRLEEALTAILSVANYTWVDRDGIIMITSLSDSDLPPGVQGRSTEIFDLNFVSASVISETVSNLLSPIGKMSVVEADPTDNRRTREMIVVEDIPEALARISNYICRVDCPPRQVLIEAHILQVTLKDTEKNGVNFNALFRVAGARVNIISIPSLASVPIPSAGSSPTPPSTPAVLATVAGTDLQAVIDLLQTTNQTKTLGSPKVLVLNQQEATIHVGEDLGYQTTVITELQTTQAPQFLQIGVLLRITPRITRDNRVLLHVRPEVSTGNIDPITQVPNKRTTELETDVMLKDGEGMVIGGLIDEQDITNQTKWPYLGDLWRVGALFRHSEVIKDRKEVIIALIPRIQPYSPDYSEFEQGEWVRSATPLYKGPLCYVDRPNEPRLPDGKRVARTYIPPRANLPEAYRGPCNYCESPWPKYYVPNKPYPQQNPAGAYDDGYCLDGGCTTGDCGPDGCATGDHPGPGLSQPNAWAQPEVSGEFVPSYDSSYGDADYGDSGYSDSGYGPASPFADDSIISDQP